MSLNAASRTVSRISQSLKRVKLDVSEIPIASSSKTPYSLLLPRRRLLHGASSNYLAVETRYTKRHDTATFRRHPAYSSHPNPRYMSSLTQPTPTLSEPSIPFPSTSSSSISHYGLTITPPSLSAIQEEGYLDDDIQLIPQSDAWINITPEAIKQLVSITSREPPELLALGKLALRVGVESGGCHGYQYTMAITEERGVDDYVMQPEGVKSIPVVIDIVSLGLLKGATLHHATELIGSSFRLQDNPQAKEGGACGCGVSWEAKA